MIENYRFSECETPDKTMVCTNCFHSGFIRNNGTCIHVHSFSPIVCSKCNSTESIDVKASKYRELKSDPKKLKQWIESKIEN